MVPYCTVLESRVLYMGVNLVVVHTGGMSYRAVVTYLLNLVTLLVLYIRRYRRLSWIELCTHTYPISSKD